jgi:hypothetical protein
MEQKNNEGLSRFETALQEFITREYSKYIALKPGQKLVCNLSIREESPVVISSPRLTPTDINSERRLRKLHKLTDAEWHHVLSINFPNRLRKILEEIKVANRDTVPISAIPSMNGPENSTAINNYFRVGNLPYRLVILRRHGSVWPRWRGGDIATHIIPGM